MAKKSVGTLIKEARTKAGLTQEQLAKKIKGLSANDISLAERGEKELTQAVLKQIAKICGVSQSSLISTKTKKTSTSMKLSSAEKKIIELYRQADTKTKKEVLSLLKGEDNDGDELLNTLIQSAGDFLSSLNK